MYMKNSVDPDQLTSDGIYTAFKHILSVSEHVMHMLFMFFSQF